MPKHVAVKKLDWAERWLRDGLEISQLPAAVKVIEIDATRATEVLQVFRASGERVTITHLIIRAAALSLARNPDLNVMLAGNRRFYPPAVTIGVSVAAGSFVAPVLVIAEAENKSVVALAREMAERKAGLLAESEEFLKRLRRWGRLVPFSFARRFILRFMARSFENRQKMSGTIQVTSLRGSDTAIPLTFGSTALLAIGRVGERVVAIHGQPAVRLTLNLTCTSDHRVWDGRAGEKFLAEIKNIVENGAFEEGILRGRGEPESERPDPRA